MFRELNPKEAFQNHCLAQMGVTPWLSAPTSVTGTVFMPVQPWGVTSDETMSTVPHGLTEKVHTDIASAGFDSVVAKPIVKVSAEEKEQSVHHLREQLNAGPEIIVEDLQPIEELAIDIEIEPNPASESHVTQLDIRAYSLANKLLIVSDVPQVFSQEEEVERLAIKMGKALLKEPVDEWQSSALSWPGGLKNPHFLERSDWLLGAVESYVTRLTKDFSETPMLVLAGDKISQLVDGLSDESLLKTYATARIVSLSELHRIPELRKEAWETMQSSLFTS